MCLNNGKETVRFLAIFDHLRQMSHASYCDSTVQRSSDHIPLVQINRRPYSIQPMRHILILPLAACLLVPTITHCQTNTNTITRETVAEAEKLINLDFSDSKIDMLMS